MKRILGIFSLFVVASLGLRAQPAPSPTTESVTANKTTGALVGPTNFISGNNLLQSTGSYSDPSWITHLSWSKLISTPTSAAGYGITNGSTIDSWGTKAVPVGVIADLNSAQTFTNKQIAWSEITNTPTSAAGYGITNGSVLDAFASDGIAFFVPASRTVNGHALGANISITPSDLTLVIGTNTEQWSTNLDSWSAKTPYAGTVTVTTGKTLNSTNSLTLSGTDASTLNIGTGGTLGSNAYTSTAFVPQTTTVNGHALSANVSVTASDVGLGSVTNAVQTLASIVPNTAPAAAQVLVGNAGGTAYAPVSVTGDVTVNSSGVTAIGANKVSNADLAQGAASSFKGNNTGSTANEVDMTVAQAWTLMGVEPAANVPAFTGDVTKSSGSLTTALANIPNAVTMAGDILATNIVAPSTPASGKNLVYFDSTSKNIASKNDAGTVNHGIQSQAGTAHQWLATITDAGATTTTQPAFTDISGSVAASQMPALTGDVTSTAGTTATTVGKINGVSLGSLGTGILKNTTTTGLPSIAIAADFPTLNQNTTGNAATVTTNANLTGDVTSLGNAATVVKINGISLAGLVTGILKNTTTTGAPSIAVAADFPTLNQNTTGSAGSVAAANITGTTLASGITASSLTSAAGGSFGSGAYASTYSLPTASVSILGGVMVDGTTITITGGVISAAGGGSGSLNPSGTITPGYIPTWNSGTTLIANQYVPSANMPALTGDVTTSAGGVSTTVAAIDGNAVSIAGSFTISGAHTFSATLTGNTSVTFPTSGTLSTTTGTVTSMSTGNLSPLFTASVGTSTTTPALSFTLSSAGANTVFGNNTGSSAAPSFQTSISLTGNITTTANVTGLELRTSGTVSAGTGPTIQTGVGITGPPFNAGPITDAWFESSLFSGVNGSQMVGLIIQNSVSNGVGPYTNNSYYGEVILGSTAGGALFTGGNGSSYQLYIGQAVALGGSPNYGIYQLGTDENFFGGGIVAGAATGGNQGVGTVNVSGGLYVNGVAVGSLTPTLTSLTVNNAVNFGGTAYTYGALPSGATTAGTVSTVPATTYTVTGTNTATAFQANYHGIATFTDSSAGTVTDLFNEIWNGPTAIAGSLAATRKHTLGVVDSTDSTTSITGAFVISTTLGTTATSIGMGNGDLVAGGKITGNTLISAVATGTAPLTVTSTTNVANLNASSLGGATFAAPGPIGSTTKSTLAGTTLTANGAVTFTAGTASTSDATGTVVITGGLGISGALWVNNASYVIASTTTWTGGGTANAPTLTTGPVAGNPTKWVPFNDAGTTRYCPMW